MPPPPATPARNGHPAPARRGAAADFLLPHHRTFTAVFNQTSRLYRWTFDEALRDSAQNALAMGRDGYLLALRQERALAVAHLPWTVESDDKKDPQQKVAAQHVTAVLKAMPNFFKMRYYLLFGGVWQGRYGAQLVWGPKQIGGVNRLAVLRHKPVNGDKIQYDVDANPCVMVNAQWAAEIKDRRPDVYDRAFAEDREITTRVLGDRAPMLRLADPLWRQRFVIHQHELEDADYFEGELAGGVHGVGLRHRLYWLHWMRQEMMAWAVTAMERAGTGGVMVFPYPDGSAEAKAKAEEQAKASATSTAFAVPVPMGQDPKNYAPLQIAYATGGVEVLQGMISDYFERHEERLVVGQSMSSGNSRSNGLGSARFSELAENTKYQIIKSDAENLGETLTNDLVSVVRRYNLPACLAPLHFRIAVPDPDAEKKLEAAKVIFDMGLPLKTDDLYQAAGFTPPQDDDEVTGMAGESVVPGEEPFGQGGAFGDDDGDPDGFGGEDKGDGTSGGSSSFGRENKDKPGEDHGGGGPVNYAADDFMRRLTAAASDVHGEPSDAQKESGNYRKGHVSWKGLPLTIETAKGQKRRGVSKDGKEWSVTMRDHYGYVKQTESDADGDHIDVFVSEDYPDSDVVFVVNQVDPATGRFDEHKCVLGQVSERGAREAYLRNYSDGWGGLGSVVALTVDQFKAWLARGESKGKLRDPVNYAADDGSGRWVTIGAKGAEGEKSGGTPVYITSDGTIARGPAGLTGKAVHELQSRKRREAREDAHALMERRVALEARMAGVNEPPEAKRDPTAMEAATGDEFREPGVGKPGTPGRFGHSPDADSWLAMAARVPAAALNTARTKVQAAHAKLAERYGEKYATAIVAAGLAGVPVPVPGASLATAAPVIAVAELHRFLSGGGKGGPAAATTAAVGGPDAGANRGVGPAVHGGGDDGGGRADPHATLAGLGLKAEPVTPEVQQATAKAAAAAKAKTPFTSLRGRDQDPTITPGSALDRGKTLATDRKPEESNKSALTTPPAESKVPVSPGGAPGAKADAGGGNVAYPDWKRGGLIGVKAYPAGHQVVRLSPDEYKRNADLRREAEAAGDVAYEKDQYAYKVSIPAGKKAEDYPTFAALLQRTAATHPAAPPSSPAASPARPADRPATQRQIDYLHALNIDVNRAVRDHGHMTASFASWLIELHKSGNGVGSANVYYKDGSN